MTLNYNINILFNIFTDFYLIFPIHLMTENVFKVGDKLKTHNLMNCIQVNENNFIFVSDGYSVLVGRDFKIKTSTKIEGTGYYNNQYNYCTSFIPQIIDGKIYLATNDCVVEYSVFSTSCATEFSNAFLNTVNNKLMVNKNEYDPEYKFL